MRTLAKNYGGRGGEKVLKNHSIGGRNCHGDPRWETVGDKNETTIFHSHFLVGTDPRLKGLQGTLQEKHTTDGKGEGIPRSEIDTRYFAGGVKTTLRGQGRMEVANEFYTISTSPCCGRTTREPCRRK